MNTLPGDIVQVFQCECSSPRHQLTVRYTAPIPSPMYGEHGWPPMLTVTMYLSSHLPWYKRLTLALKYVLRLGTVRAANQPFEDTMLSGKDAREFIELLTCYVEASETFEKECEAINEGRFSSR